MSETLPQVDSESNDDNKQVEAALAAALSGQSNPIDDAHRQAVIAEDFLNGYFDEMSAEDEEEADVDDMADVIVQTISELNDNCNHMHADVVVTGLVRSRSLDHRFIDEEDESTIVPKEALIDEWIPVDRRIATSLGYFALRIHDGDKRIGVYHGVRTQAEAIIQSREAGGIYKTSHLYLPVDGSASAELQFPTREVNYDLLYHYLGEDFMYDIDTALYQSQSLAESIQRLGKMNLKKAIPLFVDNDVRYSLNDYVNNALDIKQEILYEISGASFVQYEDDDGNDVTCRLNKNIPMVGHVNGIGVDVDAKRFRLVAAMPFNDDSIQYVSYHINSQFTVKRLPAFSVSTTAKLRVQ